MGSTEAGEKTAEELRKEIEELKRQQWEITERLRDPRGLRRAGFAPNGPRPNVNGVHQRGIVRPAERVDSEDQPPPKRRLSSAVVKVGGEATEEELAVEGDKEVKEGNAAVNEAGAEMVGETVRERTFTNSLRLAGPRRGGLQRTSRINYDVPPEGAAPRVLPKDEDPNLKKRNRRMLGQLLGTLEKFREEDKQLSTSEAFLRRNDSLKRAEQKAREESERLRQQEREQIAEKRRRDLTLRARVAAKAEEKRLELLFIQWADHQRKLCNFLRTKAEPSIYYLPNKLADDNTADLEQKKEQAFIDWKSARRAELSEYQKKIEEQYVANVEQQLEKWQIARNARRSSNTLNLQESMDKDLETHQLEHGPKTRRIPEGNVEEDDVEDIAAEDDILDDVLGDEENRRVDTDVGNLEADNDVKT